MKHSSRPQRRIRLAVSLGIVAALVAGVTGVTASLSGRHDGSATAAATAGVKNAGGYTVVVNKKRPLDPLNYTPTDLVQVNVAYVGTAPRLRREPAGAVEAMFAAFTRDTGLAMQSNSAFRSYDEQTAEYRKFARYLGEAAAAETTARPGYSEHQTGLAIDVGATGSGCDARACFASTTQSSWLATNAWRFGFIIRYPRGQQAVTGYEYEPWHIRYVGPALAKKIHGHFPSLEAYFHLPAAPGYAPA